MNPIGTYQTRQVFWFEYQQFQLEKLPTKDWVCLMTSDVRPDPVQFEKFVRHSIDNGILEFKAHGQFGENLHDSFDEIEVEMEVLEKHNPIDVMTTWHSNESLADTFWQCFFATCLPETADFDNISIVCADLTGTDRSKELKGFIERFENGWLPD